MSWVLYLVIALWAIFGIFFLISPQGGKKFSQKCIHALPYWLWGIIALVFAYLLWLSASLVSAAWFVQLLAILAGIKGISLLILSKRKIEKWTDYFLQRSALSLRLWGIVVLLLAWYLFSIIS